MTAYERSLLDFVKCNSISIELWLDILLYCNITDEFLECANVPWLEISQQTLSEDFIREFQDEVNWYYISAYQVLSESFISEFRNKVYWPYIVAHQKLPNKFIAEIRNVQ